MCIYHASMLIRPEQPVIVEQGEHDAWQLVDRSQQGGAAAGWLIPQPAHAALAGEIAAKLSPEHFPGLDEKMVRAIALHDTGWGAFDARQIEALRAGDGKNFVPVSFVAEKPCVFLPAWTGSIEVAEKISAAAGYMVSRHFESLGKEPDESYSATERKQLQQFRAREQQRQKRLAGASGKTHEQLEALLQANRFCDLLSLFLCGNIELGEGASAHFTQQVDHRDGYRLGKDGSAAVFSGDSPLRGAVELSFSGVAFGPGKRGGGWFTAALR